MPATIDQLAVNTMIAPVVRWAEQMAQDAEILRAQSMWTAAQIARIEADFVANNCICQGCGLAPARWREGAWWDCDDCSERVRLDEPDYR